MAKFSISVCKGEGSLGHNNREFITPNVDPKRIPLNIIYKQEPLEEAYEKLFGEAVNQYNVKQKRSDRKINNYMEKIRMSKTGEKLYYETIIQIGNKYTCSTLSQNGELAKKILDEYMREFQKRNPNLYVFNAVLHFDEPNGTPHIHIDWIPVARDYQRGLQVRNSLDKALRQQGCAPTEDEVTRERDFINATQKWQELEKKAVEQVMERYGWERAEESGLHRKHMSMPQYRCVMSEIENRVVTLPELIYTKKVPLSEDKVIVDKTDLGALELRAKLSLIHEEASRGLEQKLIDRVGEQACFMAEHSERMLQEVDAVEQTKKDLLKQEAKLLSQTQNQTRLNVELSNKKENYEKLYQKQLGLNQENQKLKEVCLELDSVVQNLQVENRFLKNENSSLKAQISNLKAEIKLMGEKWMEKLENTKRVLFEDVGHICKAISMLKYDKTDGYRADLTQKQARLVDAIANYGSRRVRAEGCAEIADSIDKRIGISEGVKVEIKQLERKRKNMLQL